MLAQIETALQVVDKASQSSDRWLFLGLLVIVLTGGVVVIKYLVNTINTKDVAHASERLAKDAEVKAERETARAENRAEREAAKAERKSDQESFLRVITDLRAEIKLCSETIVKNSEILQRHDTDMRAAHSIEVSAIVRSELERCGIDYDKLPLKSR